MDTFWDFFWMILVVFLWVAWIMILFRIVIDIFRSDMSGWGKAGWIFLLLFLPFLGVLLYLIFQGGNMARRDVETAVAVDQAQRDYIRTVAGSAPSTAEELEKLAALKDSGVISDSEFESQKARLLA